MLCLAVCVLAMLIVFFLPGQNGLSALAILFTDGLLAAFIFLSALTAGINILCLLLPPRPSPLPRLTYLLLAFALGLGFLSLATLALGIVGLLSSMVFLILLLLPIPSGLFILQRASLQPAPVFPPSGPTDQPSPHRPCPARWLWLLAAIPLGLAILAAATPPGILWLSQNRAPDVLQHHLTVPKEYLAAGRIGFLSHNAYANLPANAEMLSLLAMTLKSDPSPPPQPTTLPYIPSPYNAVYLINFLNLGIAVLAVCAISLTASYIHAHRTTAGLILACCPWLLIVATVPYPQAPLIFYTILAAMVTLAAPRLHLSPIRTGLLAGIFVGLACGCQLTAVITVALPVLVLLLFQQILSRGRTVLVSLTYLLAAFMTLSPWLLKNLAFAGNPVFPYFYNQLGGPDFSSQLAQRWNQAHAFATSVDFSRLVSALWNQFLAHPLFGPAVILLAASLLLLTWRRRNHHRLQVDLPLLLLLFLQLLAWMTLADMTSRSLVVALVPLCLLAGRAVALMSAASARTWSIVLMLFFGCVAGPLFSLHDFLASTVSFPPYLAQDSHHYPVQDRVGTFIGQDPFGPPHLKDLNSILLPDSRTLMVGDSVSFYWSRPVSYNTPFNRNPLRQLIIQGKSPRQIIDWLIANKFTHLYVDFWEIHRLSEKYNYSPLITPQLMAHLTDVGLLELQRFNPHAHPSEILPAILYRVLPPLPPKSIIDSLPPAGSQVRLPPQPDSPLPQERPSRLPPPGL